MRSGKADTEQWRNKRHSFKKLRKRYDFIIPFIGKIITVDILPEQCDLSVTAIEKFLAFSNDGRGITASFPAPGERHYAKRAHIVAASHDAYKGSHSIAIQSYR